MDGINLLPENSTVTPEENSSPVMENNTDQVKSSVKRRFKIPLKIKLLLILLGILGFAGFIVFSKIKIEQMRSLPPKPVQQQEPITQEEPEKIVWLETGNSKDNFFLKYPSDTTLTLPPEEENGDKPRVYQIVYTGEKQYADLTDDNSLLDGYIFRVTVNKGVTNSNTADFTNGKAASYKQNCSALHTISDISEVNIDTIPSTTVSIYNCPVDIEEYFVFLNNYLYEITLVYRGDLGYKEKYKQTAREILNTFTFLSKPPAPEKPNFETFYNREHRFSLVHPLLDINCCNIQGPVKGEVERIVTFGDKKAYDESNGKAFNGFSIFIDINRSNLQFSDYLDIQKTALMEDYKVITGKRPEPSEGEVMVGNVKATLLKGYAWWGDMIFLQIPNTNKIMIISKVESSPVVFEEIFRTILSTFAFNVDNRSK